MPTLWGGRMNEADVLRQLGPAGVGQHWVYWCGCGACTPILGSALRCAGCQEPFSPYFLRLEPPHPAFVSLIPMLHPDLSMDERLQVMQQWAQRIVYILERRGDESAVYGHAKELLRMLQEAPRINSCPST